MSLLFQLEQQLISNHLKDPSNATLYNRDAAVIARRAAESDDPDAINAALGALTLALAMLIYNRQEREVIVNNVMGKLTNDINDLVDMEQKFIADVSPKSEDAVN